MAALSLRRGVARKTDQRVERRCEAGHAGSLKGGHQLLEGTAPAPGLGLSFHYPHEGLGLLLALLDEEDIEAGNLDAVPPQRFVEVAAIEGEEKVGRAGYCQGTDMYIAGITGQRREVNAFGNR
jgi:hypothetical protein